VPLSKAREDYQGQHASATSFIIEPAMYGGFTVKNTASDKVYQVTLNIRHQCQPWDCNVECKHCAEAAACSHTYKCTCPFYMLRNFCKHLHMINEPVINQHAGKRRWPK
jgi:hypothetical protein